MGQQITPDHHAKILDLAKALQQKANEPAIRYGHVITAVRTLAEKNIIPSGTTIDTLVNSLLKNMSDKGQELAESLVNMSEFEETTDFTTRVALRSAASEHKYREIGNLKFVANVIPEAILSTVSEALMSIYNTAQRLFPKIVQDYSQRLSKKLTEIKNARSEADLIKALQPLPEKTEEALWINSQLEKLRGQLLDTAKIAQLIDQSNPIPRPPTTGSINQ